ncbi:MAG: DUF481 domain-containing protein [Gemmatimonadales bacterium]|nr:DUF481 domain-containing protein [Gemmatimonadales bacterium]NIN12565.1 DUF481 domain-containing protein [Gemmatimonadales bacterium]NIR03560.1 DUF481 domain-containing protein [Gemmatimonadales bacterium]NIS65882.1 DUF481 domain-containing protein [Gemmatimonadales bacterium]
MKVGLPGVWLGGTVSLLCLTVTALSAQQTLVLDNGDRLSGRVLRIESGVWIFQSAVGEAKVPAIRVAGFTAPEPIGVRLSDGTIAAASIVPDGSRLTLSLSDGSTRRVLATEIAAVGGAEDLEALMPVPVGFFSPFTKFWGASASVGFSDKSGNSRARGITASLAVQRRSPRDRLTINLGLNREQSRNAEGDFELTVSKYYGTLRADVYLSERLFVFANTLQERDRFQDIDLRSNYGGGLGIQALSSGTTDLRFSLSGGLRIESFTSGGRETAAVLNLGADLRQRLGPASFAWDVAWAPSIEDPGDYRLRSEASVTTTVYKGLGFRVGILNELNSRPRPGIQKHDLLVTTTLAYSVGQRD